MTSWPTRSTRARTVGCAAVVLAWSALLLAAPRVALTRPPEEGAAAGLPDLAGALPKQSSVTARLTADPAWIAANSKTR